MGLRIVERQGGLCRAALEGDLDIYAAAALKGELAAAAAGAGELEIDLAAVGAIDCAGLQLMLMAKRLPGTAVRFVRHAPAVLELVELSRLAGVLGDPLLLSAAERAPS